jgi:hypothetical protein
MPKQLDGWRTNTCSKSGMVTLSKSWARLDVGTYTQKMWHLCQAQDDKSPGVITCCSSKLTEALHARAAGQLAGCRIFPSRGGDQGIRVVVLCAFGNSAIIHGCLNQLTSTSAYHLLHLLHHLNGTSFDKISDFADAWYTPAPSDEVNIWLEPAIFGALLSAYAAIDTCPRSFKLYSRTRHFYPHAEPLLPIKSIVYYQEAILDLYDTDLRTVLDWVLAILCRKGPVETNAIGRDDRINYFLAHIWPTRPIRFRVGHLHGEQIDQIVEASSSYSNEDIKMRQFRPSVYALTQPTTLATFRDRVSWSSTSMWAGCCHHRAQCPSRRVPSGRNCQLATITDSSTAPSISRRLTRGCERGQETFGAFDLTCP